MQKLPRLNEKQQARQAQIQSLAKANGILREMVKELYLALEPFAEMVEETTGYSDDQCLMAGATIPAKRYRKAKAVLVQTDKQIKQYRLMG